MKRPSETGWLCGASRKVQSIPRESGLPEKNPAATAAEESLAGEHKRLAGLIGKSIVKFGYRGERLIEPSSSWFPPKFPSG